MPTDIPQKVTIISWPKVILTVLIIVVVAGAIGGALFWYFYVRQPAETTSMTTTNQATTSAKKATPSAQKDETDDWKIYESTTFKYSFKYPNSWSIKKETAFLDDAKTTPLESVSLEDTQGKSYLRIHGNFQGGWCEGGGETPVCREETTTLSGVEGKKWTNLDSGSEIYSFASKKIVIFEQVGTQKELFRKILSTFRFD